MHKAAALFESYNMAISCAYDSYLENNSENDGLKDITEGSEKLMRYLAEREGIWNKNPLPELGGLTPEEFFKTVGSLDHAMELLKIAALVCDEDLPDLLLSCLRAYGAEAEDKLAELVCKASDDENSLSMAVFAVKTLAGWKSVRTIPQLITALTGGSADELYLETLRNALIYIGKPVLTEITQSLSDEAVFGIPQEYLLMALSAVGGSNRSEEVYRTLKNSFLKMDNKIVGASCLAEYGDGRAIPSLRGYIEKNLSSIDKMTFYELKSAIEKLGGNIDDIKYGK